MGDEHIIGGRAHLPWDAGAAVDARLEAMLGSVSGPLNWRAVNATDARACWRALREWVDWFRVEFGFDHRVVPPCWYRHSALVNLLSAVRDHWLYAYDPMNTSLAASDWHRALIVLEQRLREWAARTGCTVNLHRPDVLAEYPDDGDGWGRHLADDIAEREKRQQAEQPSDADSSDARVAGRAGR